MANSKKVVLIFSDVTTHFLYNNEDPQLVKLRQKGTLAPLTVKSDLKKEVGSGALDGEMLWEACQKAGLIVEDISQGSNLTVAYTHGEAEMLALVAKAIETENPKLIICIVTSEAALFYGYGIERKQVLEKPISASSITPTLVWLADLALPAQVEAAPAYQVLKGLNFKQKESFKLNDTLDALMLNIERANRQPWDKHDCA